MIHFKELNTEGFGSLVKPTLFKLDQPGLNIIRGKVGAGKTSIPSALTWCLFGETLKNKSSVETWPELRDSDFKGTRVDIVFTKSDDIFKITRCLNYKGKLNIGGKKLQGGSKLLVYKNDELLANDRNKKQVQKSINKIIGYSFNLFKNSVVFGQRVKRIIEESGPDKKKIFDEGFDISFIEEAREKEKAERDKLVQTKAQLDSNLDGTLDKIETLKEQYNDAIEYEKTFEKNKNSILKELNSKCKSYVDLKRELSGKGYKKPKELKAIKDKLTEAEKTLKTRNKLKDKVAELKRQKTNILEKIEEIPSKFNKCPECGSKERIPQLKKKAKEDKAMYNAKLDDIKKQIKNIGEVDTKAIALKIQNYSIKITRASEAKDKQKHNKKKLSKVDHKIAKTEKKIAKLVNKKLVVKSTKFKAKITKLDKLYKTQKREIRSLDKQIEIKDWLIKDPLSNNGLKAYMFDSLLEELNNTLLKYSGALGFEVAFGIDLDSNRKDFYQAIEKDGIIIPYEDLSGGQKQLVDTTVALAIHDVISKLRPTNIVFMDEPFESLDEENVEIIEEIIESKAKGKSLFLITHKKTFNPLQANVISFKLNNKKQTEFY